MACLVCSRFAAVDELEQRARSVGLARACVANKPWSEQIAASDFRNMPDHCSPIWRIGDTSEALGLHATLAVTLQDGMAVSGIMISQIDRDHDFIDGGHYSQIKLGGKGYVRGTGVDARTTWDFFFNRAI